MDHAHNLSSALHHLRQTIGAGIHPVNGLPGFWALSPRRAVTLKASQVGVLRIARGRVWITFNDAGLDHKVRAGDYFLSQGESLSLSSGQTLVMESFGVGDVEHAYFSWEPAAVIGSWPANWRISVVQPLLDQIAAACKPLFPAAGSRSG